MEVLSTIASNANLIPKINSWRFDFLIFMYFKIGLRQRGFATIFNKVYFVIPWF
jgi:hypothetical protein